MEDNKNKDNKGKNNDNNDNKEKFFTQSDFDREISKIYEKLESKFTKREEKIKLDAEKKANMNAEERLNYEMEQREQAINEKEKEFILRENKYQCSKILQDKGLPVLFADFIVTDDADKMQNNINLLDIEFKKAIKSEVEKRLKGNTPKQGNTNENGTITKEQFRKMSIAEQTELFRNNPELYKQLIK